jgi:hypothetical protein
MLNWLCLILGVCRSCFRSCIACSFIPVHVQKLFSPLFVYCWGCALVLISAHYTFLFYPTGHEWSSVPNIVYNGGWVRIILVFCCIDGTPWTQFQSRPKWHALSTLCIMQGPSLSLSLSLKCAERNRLIYHVLSVERSHLEI